MGTTNNDVIVDINPKDGSENYGIKSEIISGSNSSTDSDESGNSSKDTCNFATVQDSDENSSSSKTNEVSAPSTPFRRNKDAKDTFVYDDFS